MVFSVSVTPVTPIKNKFFLLMDQHLTPQKNILMGYLSIPFTSTI